MPELKFFMTQTNLPREKIRKVLGGYGIVESCVNHQPTEINPNLHIVQELIIDSKKYPAALLFPWGYVINDSESGQYPDHTIFFFKHHLQYFENMHDEFNLASDNAEFTWPCGCRIRKYSQKVLEKLCSEPWYPWIGEREQAIRSSQKTLWMERKRTTSSEEIVEVLQDAGLLNSEQAREAIRVIKFHRGVI